MGQIKALVDVPGIADRGSPSLVGRGSGGAGPLWASAFVGARSGRTARAEGLKNVIGLEWCGGCVDGVAESVHRSV